MGWDIKAGKKRERIGYAGYINALRDIAHVLDPAHEHIFSNPFAYSEAEWSAKCRECKHELYLLCCASDLSPTYYAKEAAEVADFLEKITEPTERVKMLQDIFLYARRYHAHVYFS